MLKLGYSKTFTYLMGGGIAWSLWALAKSPPPLFDAIVLVVLCFAVTDLISGLLHVILDNPRSLDVGAIRGLAEGFQRHHRNPAKIYEQPLYEHLYVMHMPLTFLFGVVFLFGDARMYVVFLSMCGALHLMQMAHLWAHLPREQLPRVARALQRSRMLLNKPQHDLHHTEPFDKDFCIMSGFCNPPLNRAVRVIGTTTHWWMAIFLVVALSPLAVAYAM